MVYLLRIAFHIQAYIRNNVLGSRIRVLFNFAISMNDLSKNLL